MCQMDQLQHHPNYIHMQKQYKHVYLIRRWMGPDVPGWMGPDVPGWMGSDVPGWRGPDVPGWRVSDVGLKFKGLVDPHASMPRGIPFNASGPRMAKTFSSSAVRGGTELISPPVFFVDVLQPSVLSHLRSLSTFFLLLLGFAQNYSQQHLFFW